MLFVKLNDNSGTIEIFTRKGEMITEKTPIIEENDIIMVVPRDAGKLKEIKKRSTPIKLGLTHKGTDTTSEQSQSCINQHDCHPALIDMYLTPEGRLYRRMTTRVELSHTIKDFESEQYHLRQLKEAGFVVFDGEIEELA